MRIISGKKKGMKLLIPKTDVTRPIIDRVKESLFDILSNYELPSGKVVADLFSGVGSLGLEALSREAEFVCFVEKDSQIAEILKKNIAKAGFENQSKVFRANVFSTGAAVFPERGKYDLVFIDPPYKLTEDVSEKSRLSELFELLSKQTQPDCIIVVRTFYKVELLQNYDYFKVFDRREWGTMAVSFLSRIENE